MPFDLLPIFAWSSVVATLLVPLWMLAPVDERDTVCAWLAIGVTAYAVKHLLIVALPQWSDTPLDASAYVTHAEALSLHWSGLPVDPEAYRLAGYIHWWGIEHGRLWMPNAPIPYAGVLGTSEWLYAGLLGLHLPFGAAWLNWATATNLLIAAMLPAMSWLLATELGAGRVGATAAATLMAVDPTTSINASWLLKDVLTTAVAMLALLAACRLRERSSLKALLILALALAALSATRFVGFIAIALALTSIVFVGLARRDALPWTHLLAVALSLLLSAGIAAYPQVPEHTQIIDTLINRFTAVNETLVAGERAQAFDPAVHEWRDRLRNDPLLAGLQVIARTLCAPYPWSFLKQPLTGESHMELYLLGSLVWLLSLPLIGIGLLTVARRRTFVDLLCLGVISALAFAYIVTLGEWSTRQRAFMNPLFFAFFGIGLMRARSWLSAGLPHRKTRVACGQRTRIAG